MRILYGITKANFGGAQRYVLDLALETKKMGHEVSVVCGGDGPLVKKLNEANIRVISLPSLERDINILGDLKAFFDLLSLLFHERPDVFHINSSKMGAMGTLAGRIAFIRRIIFTAHGWAFNEKRSEAQISLIKKLAWFTVFLSHKTICVSERLKLDMVERPSVQKKLVVIHNGIEVFRLLSKESARKKLDIKLPEGSLLVGTLSELHHTKGLDIALRAINKSSENIHFAILGGGEAKRELEALAKNLGLGERVRFFGFIDNAREYLKAFDIFTLTSRTEGLPYVLLEAGLAELPVVATDVGGVSEVIQNKETGILLEKENPKTLTEAVEKLSTNIEERKRLGQNLKNRVIQNFSKERMVEETFNLYQ